MIIVGVVNMFMKKLDGFKFSLFLIFASILAFVLSENRIVLNGAILLFLYGILSIVMVTVLNYQIQIRKTENSIET